MAAGFTNWILGWLARPQQWRVRMWIVRTGSARSRTHALMHARTRIFKTGYASQRQQHEESG